MKKFVTVLATAFLLTGCVNASEAAVFQPCSAKKVNVVSNNKICKKVGVFYRWVSLPTESKAPTATPKPSPTITAQPITAADYSVLLTSFDDVDKYLFVNDYRLPTNNLKFGPSLDPKIVSNGTEAFTSIASVFSTFYSPSYYYAIVTSEKDREWAASPSINKIDSRFTGLYGNTCENGNSGNEWSSISCTWSDKTEWYRMELLAHEYTHSVIYSTGGTKTGSVSNYQRAFDIPSWLNEGAATYYGWWLGSLKDPNISAHIKNHLNGFACSVTGYSDLPTPEKLAMEMKQIETGAGHSFKQYGYGAIAVAELVSKYGGHKAMLDFYTQMRYTSNWKDAFEKSFGVTPDKFYVDQYKDFIKMLPDLTCKR